MELKIDNNYNNILNIDIIQIALSCVTENKEEEAITRCRSYLLSSGETSSLVKQLLGNDEAEQLEIVNDVALLSDYRTQLASNNAGFDRLNGRLSDHVYISIPYRLTFSDLMYYVSLYPVVNNLEQEDKVKYCNVWRWFDHIQHLPSLAQKCNLDIVTPPTSPDIEKIFSSATDNSPVNKRMTSEEAEAKRKEKADKKAKRQNKQAKATPVAVVDIARANFRVGRLTHVEFHENADSLFVEQVDIGLEEPLTICSGLRKYFSKEDLEGRLCVIFVNLKPADMRGVLSQGMVLCVSTTDKKEIEFLSPPPSCNPGDAVFADGITPSPDKVLSSKRLSKILKVLKTSAEGIPQYQDLVLTTSSGNLLTSSLSNASIC